MEDLCSLAIATRRIGLLSAISLVKNQSILAVTTCPQHPKS
jgi:hypothetical protein